MVLNYLFIGQQWRNRHREQSYGHGERGREVRCMETYITINSQQEFVVWLRKLKQRLCVNLEE